MILFKYRYRQIYFAFFLGSIITISCANKGKRTDLETMIHYLDIDSVHKTPEAKSKFALYKKQFENMWLDSMNCYMYDYLRKPRCVDCRNKTIIDYKIDNILFADGYKKAIVLITFYAAFIDSVKIEKYQITEGKLMKANIDENGKWHFDCNLNNIGSYDSGNGNKIEVVAKALRKMVIETGYFDVNSRKVNESYVSDFFIKEVK